MTTGYLSTDKTIGNREDLTDILTNISPTRTPFISSIGRATASGVYHEWQTDSLQAAATNAIGEGASAAPASGAVTTRIGNRCQIMEKIVTVTRTNNRVSKAGRGSEWAYQMEKKMKELARDLEYNCVYNSAQASGEVTAASPRYMEGLGLGNPTGTGLSALSSQYAGWLSANVIVGSAGAGLACASAGGYSAASGRVNLTETMLNNLLQEIWSDGGDPTLVLVGGYNKRVISSFTGNGTRFNTVTNADGKTLSSNVRIYESDFGSINIQESHFIEGSRLGAVDPSYFAIAELEPLFFEELAKTGDRMLGHYIMEATLEARAPESGGAIYCLATAAGATATF
jgi:hypothetical protein